MSFVLVACLISLLAVRELLSAYYEPGDPKPTWFSWLTYGTYALLVGFAVVFVSRVLDLLALIQ